jgi:hypothetical protein
MKCTFLIVSRTRAGKWRGEMLCSNEAKVGDYSPGRLCGWHDDVVNHPEAIRERYERSKIERQKQAREAKTDSEEMMPEPYRMRPRSGIPEGLGRKGGTALGCRIPMIKRGRTIYIVHHGKTGDDGRCVDCGKRPRRKAEAGE